MQPEKHLATAESNSVDNESTDTGPSPGRPSIAPSAAPMDMRRRSQSSVRSESRARASISCVSRESTSGDDCARQRFIVWAAVKRNRSVRMAASERLRCPLLRCGERFDEHEEMLRHLTQCQHLSTGEYVCYECMQIERFNDKKCTCCFGQPTKRRRIINMAKNFFSSIGSTKVRRENTSPPTNNTQCSPPSYESLVVDIHEQYGQTSAGVSAPLGGGAGEYEQLGPGQPHIELNGTELLELDSAPLRPAAELDAVNYDAHLTMPSSLGSCNEMRDAPLSPMPSVISKPRQSPCSPTMMQSNMGAPGGGRRPSLALNTQIDRYRTKPQTTYLSPSSSLRSSSNGISPITPWSTNSKSSAIWSAASGRDTMLASPITPLSANANSMMLQENHALSTEKDMDLLTCPENPFHYALGDVPELPENNQLPPTIPRLLPDPFVFSYNPKDDYSWLSSINTDISSTSVNMMFTDPNVKTAIPRGFLGSQMTGSEAKGLVEQVWDALGEHLSNSVSKISRLQNNSLADSLRAQTTRAVAAAGLARFRRAINPNYAAQSDPLEYLCFVHLIYSMSLVMYEDNLTARSNKLYEQALAYGAALDITHRDNYYQIVTAIWQQNSQESTSRGRDRDSANRSAGNKGKEPDYHTGSAATANLDPLVFIGQNFLDELENTMIRSNTQQSIEVNSELWSLHLSSNQSNLQQPSAFTLASPYIVQDLCRRYLDSDDILPKLKVILQNTRAGYYTTIRKLELELIQMGKNHFSSNEFLDQYILHVRGLCDQIYLQPANRSRAEYHSLGISLFDSLIPSVSRESQQLQQPQQGHSEYPFPYAYEDNIFHQQFEWPYTMIPTTQQPEGVEVFGSSSLVLGGLHQATPDGSHLPIRSDASETPSDSYTVSPAPLSDVPPEIPSSASYRQTPPSQPQREGSEIPGPSTLPSSGQKVEANERCEICGYRPKGDPQWFKGSMAKHKKMQHSTNPPVIYKCPFPGCSSEYKNRRDNLRQHQIEKNHFVGDEQRPAKRKRREHA